MSSWQMRKATGDRTHTSKISVPLCLRVSVVKHPIVVRQPSVAPFDTRLTPRGTPWVQDASFRQSSFVGRRLPFVA